MLQSMGLQSVGHDWVTEKQQMLTDILALNQTIVALHLYYWIKSASVSLMFIKKIGVHFLFPMCLGIVSILRNVFLSFF